MELDHGSGKALGGALLQLVGGILIGCAMWFGYVGGRVTTFGAGIGIFAGMYFVISGGVRLYIGYATRRASR